MGEGRTMQEQLSRATQGAVAEGFCRSDGGNGLKIELKYRKCEVKEERFSKGSPE